MKTHAIIVFLSWPAHYFDGLTVIYVQHSYINAVILTVLHVGLLQQQIPTLIDRKTRVSAALRYAQETTASAMQEIAPSQSVVA